MILWDLRSGLCFLNWPSEDFKGNDLLFLEQMDDFFYPCNFS